jgi:UDP-2,4-diacetamido-2,4,6-trideoxy-beta-L-altropyranose hydrolase
LILKSKNVAFRVDASAQMGLGHFMRCLTLADALKERGANTRFLSRNLPAYLQRLLQSKDHEATIFGSLGSRDVCDPLAHASWLESTQQQDATECAKALADLSWDWIVVDHYALDKRWESAASGLAKRVMVIDDIADRRHQADVLLDQNLYLNMQQRYAGLLNAGCVQLLGPQYALLRTEFLRQRENSRVRDGNVKKLLVFFGGTDATNETGKTLEAIGMLNMPELELDIVVGASNPHLAQLETQGGKRVNTRIHRQVSNMAELIQAADLAIGAAGTATWERCALGLPALVMAVAENQIEIARGVAHFKAHQYLGACADVSVEKIASELRTAIESPFSLREMSRAAFSLVDGLGADRLVAVLQEAV